MLETVGQFRLQYSDQAQGAPGSLVAMPSLPSRVIECKGRTQRYYPSRTEYSQVSVTKLKPSTQMVVFDIRDGSWFSNLPI